MSARSQKHTVWRHYDVKMKTFGWGSTKFMKTCIKFALLYYIMKNYLKIVFLKKNLLKILFGGLAPPRPRFLRRWVLIIKEFFFFLNVVTTWFSCVLYSRLKIVNLFINFIFFQTSVSTLYIYIYTIVPW